MPCNSDYMEPSPGEVNYSRVLCVLGELNGDKVGRDWWRGYHPLIYNRGMTKAVMDEKTAEACEGCRKLGSRISNKSLELQMWYREHKEADLERREREIEAKRNKLVREKALAKLTDEDKKALGFK